jgi:hypothetical protein
MLFKVERSPATNLSSHCCCVLITENLYLDSNDLTSTIPSQIVSLPHLGTPHSLSFSSVSIKSSRNCAVVLEHLSLHKQMLVGTIPTEFGLAMSLSRFLYCLTIWSHIISHSHFLLLPCNTTEEVYLYENSLTGFVLTELSLLSKSSWPIFILDIGKLFTRKIVLIRYTEVA